MKGYRLFAILFLMAIESVQALAGVKVNIGWEYRGVESPIELFEVKGRPHLWETKSVKSSETAPIGTRIGTSAFEMSPQEVRRFVLVMKNNSDKPIYFFAAPHQVLPPEYSLGFKFKCLCVNHAYTVGPHETWYRVVELRLSDGFVGDKMSITHTIIGIDAKRAKEFSQPREMPDM